MGYSLTLSQNPPDPLSLVQGSLGGVKHGPTLGDSLERRPLMRIPEWAGEAAGYDCRRDRAAQKAAMTGRRRAAMAGGSGCRQALDAFEVFPGVRAPAR